MSTQFKFCKDSFAKLDKKYASHKKGIVSEHKPSIVLRSVFGALNGVVHGTKKAVLYPAIEKEWDAISSFPCPGGKYLLLRARLLCTKNPELGLAIPAAKRGAHPAYIKQSAGVPLTEAEQKILDAGATGILSHSSTSLENIIHSWRQEVATLPEGKAKEAKLKAIEYAQVARYAANDANILSTYKSLITSPIRRKYTRKAA